MDDIDRPTGFHPVNIGHLVMGVVILAGLGCWALVQTDTVTGDDIHWLLPVPWVLAGVVGLVATAVTGSRRYAVRQTGWVGHQADQADQADHQDLADQHDHDHQYDDQNDRPNDPEETP